jgi:hypothetical protein
VRVNAPKRGKLNVHTRTGYYAKEESESPAPGQGQNPSQPPTASPKESSRVAGSSAL